MPPSELVKLSQSEDAFIAEVLKARKGDVTVVIPDDMEARDALVAIRSCTAMLVKLDRATGWLAPVLGRLMALAAKNHEIYEKAGYDTLAEFEEAELIGKGISHGTLWIAKRAYEVFPSLALEDYSKIGSTKLAMASKVCKGASESQKKKILAVAAEKPVEQFREFLEHKSGLSSPGETSADAFNLIGSSAEVGELKEWLAREDFREWSGEDRPLAMILAAIKEASTQFQTGIEGAAEPEPSAEGWE